MRVAAIGARRLVLVASFASASLLNYVFGLAAGWLLGPADFGLLAFAQTLLLIGGLILETGIPWSLARALAHAPPTAQAGLVRGALVANVGLALCLASLVAVLFIAGPFRAGLEQFSILLVVCISLVCIAVSTVIRGALQGVERFWAVAAVQISEVSSKTCAGLGLVLLGQGVLGALAGFDIGGGVAICLSLWLARGLLRPHPSARALDLPRLRPAVSIFGALLAFALLLNLDLLAVKLLVPDQRALAGYYQAAIMLANLPCYLVTAAIVPLLFARLVRAGRIESTVAIVWSGLRMLALIAIPIELMLMALPDLVVGTLFPASFGPTVDLVRPIALARTALLVVALLSAAFQAVGRAGVPARILMSVVLLEALALAGAVSTWQGAGAAGVAVGASLAAVTVLGAAYVRIARSRRVHRAGARWRGATHAVSA